MVAGLVCLVAQRSSAQTYVSRGIGFNPWTQYGDRPFHELRTAYEAWTDHYNNTLGQTPEFLLAPGLYNDTGVLNMNCILRKHVGAPGSNPSDPVIGRNPIRETTFKVATWNVRLFGDTLGGTPAPAGVYFADNNRAAWIPATAALWQPDNRAPDFVAFQEVWDDGDYEDNLDNAYGLTHSHDGFASNEIEDVQHSGLYMISREPFLDTGNGFYTAEIGIDALSSKGWIAGRINKDGFTIYLFTTHAQADDENDETRTQQFNQLMGVIQNIRQNTQHALVIIMGDFNVPEGSDEWTNSFHNGIMGPNHGKDLSAHSASWIHEILAGNFHYTYNTDVNELADAFEDNSRVRYDYIIGFDSYDGRMRMQTLAQGLPYPTMGSSLCALDLTCGNFFCLGTPCTNEISDHYPLTATLRLYEMPPDDHGG